MTTRFHRTALLCCCIIAGSALLCITLAGCGQAAVPAGALRPTDSPSTLTGGMPTVGALPQTATSALPLIVTRSISNTLHGNITIDGSSTVFPITEAAAQAFSRLAPAVQIQLGVSGTGAGFKKFCVGDTSISNASRPIKQSEIELCRQNAIDFIELPIAFDGLSVVVHPDNTWATCMTVAELQRLWEPDAEGQITRWSHIRPEWPDQPIHLYGAGTDSGTFDYFTSAIMGKEGDSRRDYTASEDDYVLAQNVAADPLGMAYFGYAYYREYQDKLNIVAIDSGGGCVPPDEQSIIDARYQPLSRPLLLYVRADALERPEYAAFVWLYLDNAGLFANSVNYIPLTPAIYQLVQEQLAQRRLGSVFSGKTQVNLSVEQILLLEQ